MEAPGWDSKFKASATSCASAPISASSSPSQRPAAGSPGQRAKRPSPPPVSSCPPPGQGFASGVAANFCATIRPICWAQTKRQARSCPAQCLRSLQLPLHQSKVLDVWTPPAAKAHPRPFDSWNPPDTHHPLLAEQWADLNQQRANLVFGHLIPLIRDHWLATTDDRRHPTAW